VEFRVSVIRKFQLHYVAHAWLFFAFILGASRGRQNNLHRQPDNISVINFELHLPVFGQRITFKIVKAAHVDRNRFETDEMIKQDQFAHNVPKIRHIVQVKTLRVDRLFYLLQIVMYQIFQINIVRPETLNPKKYVSCDR
jgi:hypothetical protein